MLLSINYTYMNEKGSTTLHNYRNPTYYSRLFQYRQLKYIHLANNGVATTFPSSRS